MALFKKIITNVLLLVIASVIGVLFNYHILSEIIFNIGYGNLSIETQFILLVSMVVIIYLVLKYLFIGSDWWDKYLILNTYSIIFLIVVFGRGRAPFSGVGLNPLAFIFESTVSRRVLITSFLNIMLFIPIPLLVTLLNQNISVKNQFIIGFIIALAVELLQLIFSVGIFDVSDIVLYSIGTSIGIYIFNFYLKVDH